jgi:septal ring factor EnvC (AmiA/AmiB activator)
MDANLAIVAGSAVALVALFLGAMCAAYVARGRRADAELGRKQDRLAAVEAERDEFRRRCDELEREAEDAAERGARAVARARERGADLADPDDDAAFERVLQRARRRRAAAEATTAPGQPAAGGPPGA